MKHDFSMIVHKLSKELPFINLYPIADVHIGSLEFDEKMFKKWLKTVSDDAYGYVIMAGDLMNMGLKSSKTNCYEETMRPSQQKEYLFESLKPIKHKILAACGGNHEYRGVKDADMDPLYDVMARLQIEDLYRQNMCFVKINLGEKKNHKQMSYGIVAIHGATRNKNLQFISHFDNCDLFISGHTHNPEYDPKSKIKLDMHNEQVTMLPYRNVVCSSFQNSGGYGLRKQYPPPFIYEFQVIRLDGNMKKLNFFTIS